MPQNPSEAALRDWLRSQIADYIDLPPDEIAVDVPLSAYGVDSLYALTIIADLEEHLQIELEPELIWDYPTIEALTAFLLTSIQPASSACGATGLS